MHAKIFTFTVYVSMCKSPGVGYEYKINDVKNFRVIGDRPYPYIIDFNFILPSKTGINCSKDPLIMGAFYEDMCPFKWAHFRSLKHTSGHFFIIVRPTPRPLQTTNALYYSPNLVRFTVFILEAPLFYTVPKGYFLG